MIQLFSLFLGANAGTQTTSTPMVAVKFSTNTQQPARPFSSLTQQLIPMAWMFQGQNNDITRSMESLHTQDPYQPVNSTQSHANKSE